MHRNGEGVPQNHRTAAAHWYRLAGAARAAQFRVDALTRARGADGLQASSDLVGAGSSTRARWRATQPWNGLVHWCWYWCTGAGADVTQDYTEAARWFKRLALHTQPERAGGAVLVLVLVLVLVGAGAGAGVSVGVGVGGADAARMHQQASKHLHKVLSKHLFPHKCKVELVGW
jgi:hypothetical protein